LNWLSAFVPGYAPNGRPILSVLGKRTYRIANGKTAWYDEDGQAPFLEKDEYWGKLGPQADAVKCESDLVAFKPMTDIIYIGSAHAPKGKKVVALNAGIQVGPHAKVLRVIGDRKVQVTGTGMSFGEPEAFAAMPLHYGRAYGGKDDQSDPGVAYAYPKNPVGRGFIVKDNPKALQALELPNLEDPKLLLTPANLVLQRFDRWPGYPEPAALGPTARHFHPRYTLAGLPPDERQKAEIDRQRAMRKMPEIGTSGSTQPPSPVPILNPQFYNGAGPGLCVPFLAGNEAVKLANLDPDFPRFAFTLPGERPSAWLDVGEGPEPMAMVLHTLTVEKETNRCHAVWRGCAYYRGPESMSDFTCLEYGVEDMHG
jgi:hypothetical protein